MTEDTKDLIIETCTTLWQGACYNLALAKQNSSKGTQVVYVKEDGNDSAVNVYDFYFYVWKANDTLDKIANNLLKNADLSCIIAYFNGIADETQIKAGTKIKIPVLQETQNNSNNKIYAPPNEQDNYGKDIMIDDNGNIVIQDNDFKIIDNKQNLLQALMLRLTTASNKRIRLSSYGIRQSTGDNMALSSYLLSSIEQTVKADPRIKTIESITFNGAGDKLYVKITFTDINDNISDFEGQI